MATKKMTREQMVEKLTGLQEGMKVQHNGKIYTILSITEPTGKLCRRDICWLEDGKPRFHVVPGIGMLKGQMVERDNRIFRTLRAERPSMDFEVIA